MEKINTKLYVLTGFLGSGKTTVLLKLMQVLQGQRIGIIQNEFGKLGIDGTILRNDDVDEKIIAHIANAYRLIFHGQTSVFDAVNQVVDQVPDGPEIQNIVNFIRATKLGIISKM